MYLSKYIFYANFSIYKCVCVCVCVCVKYDSFNFIMLKIQV